MTQQLVQTNMIDHRHRLEILWSIVCLVAVFMMNVLVFCELSSKPFLYNETVFVLDYTADADLDVPARTVDTPSAFPEWMPGAAPPRLNNTPAPHTASAPGGVTPECPKLPSASFARDFYFRVNFGCNSSGTPAKFSFMLTANPIGNNFLPACAKMRVRKAASLRARNGFTRRDQSLIAGRWDAEGYATMRTVNRSHYVNSIITNEPRRGFVKLER